MGADASHLSHQLVRQPNALHNHPQLPQQWPYGVPARGHTGVAGGRHDAYDVLGRTRLLGLNARLVPRQFLPNGLKVAHHVLITTRFPIIDDQRDLIRTALVGGANVGGVER